MYAKSIDAPSIAPCKIVRHRSIRGKVSTLNTEKEKQAAGQASVQFIEEGSIVGLGTGSTAFFAIQAVAERVRAGLKIRAIPTSDHTRNLAASLGIPLTTLDEYQQIDVDIDGADEIDPQLNLIKGGGGALLREKIIASASKRFIVIADSTKLVSQLGKFPLPVEIVPFAKALVAKEIEALGASVKLRKLPNGEPFESDEGHNILDCSFGSIPDPPALALKLEAIPGVVEHGMFINMANLAVVGTGTGVKEIHAPKS
jgi:ribose 5-phosphate isomerase A